MNQNIKGITNFSDLNNMKISNIDLNHLQKLLINKSFIKDDIQNTIGETNYYKNYDHYGGHFSLMNYFMKPKLILFKIKYFIIILS